MKRCPQCEFIYEDDQDYCDMDGKELVNDSRPLQVLETSLPGFSPKSEQRKFAAVAVGIVVIGLAPIMTYYMLRPVPPLEIGSSSLGKEAPQPLGAQPTLPRPSPTTTNSSVRSLGSSGSEPETESNANDTEKVWAKQETASSRTPSQQKTQSYTLRVRKPTSGEGNHKKDSKLRSILKKTGRLLKKPFQ